MNRQENIAEFCRLETEIVASETDIEAKKWRQAQLAATAIAEGMSRKEYARQVERSDVHIGCLVKTWNLYGARHASRPRFTDAYATAQAGEETTRADLARRKVERVVPTRREDRIEMVETLLADPDVARAVAPTITDTSTISGRHISNQVLEREATEKREWSTRVKEPLTGIPLPMLWASMSVTVDKWVRELSRMEDEDLDELADGNPEGAEKVAANFDRLDGQVQRYRRRLRRRPDLKVVEELGIIDVEANVR